jgi:hypothetical protein
VQQVLKRLRRVRRFVLRLRLPLLAPFRAGEAQKRALEGLLGVKFRLPVVYRARRREVEL